MRLGKFRLKRSLMGLALMIFALSVIKYNNVPGDDHGHSNKIRLIGNQLDTRLAGNILAGENQIHQLEQQQQYPSHSQNRTLNTTNDRENIAPASSVDDDTAEENHGENLPHKVTPSGSLYLSDIRARANLLREQCAKLRGQIDRLDIIQSPPEGLIIDERFKLMYCVIPKAACSSWKEFFFEIGGYGQDKKLLHKKRKQVLKYFDHLPLEKRKKLYPKLYKFVFVRHPFMRLLSAYRDKMAPNGSYERLHSNSDNRTLYFWRNRIGMDIINTYHGPATAKRMKRNHNEYKITFKEFIRFLLDHPEHAHAEDRHWKPMYKICHPCDIRYEFIANFETIDTDSLFIRKNVRAELPERNKHATNSSNLEFALSYYKDIPKELMLKLYEKYKLDFQLFGYNPKPFF